MQAWLHACNANIVSFCTLPALSDARAASKTLNQDLLRQCMRAVQMPNNGLCFAVTIKIPWTRHMIRQMMLSSATSASRGQYGTRSPPSQAAHNAMLADVIHLLRRELSLQE